MDLILLILLLLILTSFAWGAVSAAPFVPLRQGDIKRLLDLAQTKPGELIYDLGCGDGRVLVAAVQKYKLRAIGYEVALMPYLIAIIRKLFNGFSDEMKVYLKNFWQTDLSQADIVVCFLTPPAMKKLEAKLMSELKPGARFITYAFPLPNIRPYQVSKPLSSDISIYLYTKFIQPVGKVVDM